MNLRNFYATYMRIIVGTLSSLFCFITAFHIPISFLSLLPYCLITAWILLFLYEKKGQLFGDCTLLLSLLVVGIFALVFRSWIPDAIDSITYYIQKELINLNVLSETELYIPTEQFYALDPFFRLCTVLLSCLLVLFIQRFSFAILPILLTIPLVESGLYYGAVPKYYYFFPYVIFFIVSLSLFRFRKKAIPKGFFSVFTILLVFCLFLSSVLLDTFSYERPRKWDQIRNSIILQDYDRLSELIGFTIPFSLSKSYTSINAGNLKDLGNKSKSSKTALTISMPASLSIVYLKGYVGTEYKKNQWNVQAEHSFQQKLPYFYEQSPESLTLSPLDYLAMEQNYNSNYQEEMTITPKAANKNYAYVPYTMLPNDVLSQVQDLYYTPKTRDSYTIPYGTQKGTTPISLSFPSNDLELKNAYSNYISTYTKIPSSVKKELAKATIDIKNYALEHDVSYIEAISWYFNQSGMYTYTLQPGAIKRELDATLYFLTESHKGYCVHFASATTLLLRNLGIPARYVEGYMIRPTTIATGTYDEKKNLYTFSVPVSDAHAWTEYYVEGKGWIVFDTTPSSDDETSLQVETTTSQSTQTTSTTTDQETTTETVNTASTTDTSPESTTTSSTVLPNKEKEENTFFLSLIQNRFQRELKAILIGVLVFVALFLLLLLRRYYHLYIRYKSFHQKDNNLSAIAMLEWLFYLFTLKPPSNAEKEIIQSRMKPLLDRAKYSQHVITNEELLEIEKLIWITERKTRKHLPFSRRFFHQFLSRKTLR